MELVSVIYNSLIIVFALLSLVIFSSLLFSKFNLFGGKKGRRKDSIPHYELAKIEPSRNEFHNSEVRESNYHVRDYVEDEPLPKINQELIESNKIRVVNRIEDHKEMERDFQYNAVRESRFTVVNRAIRQNPRREIFQKYATMSVEYSQTA